MNGLMEINNHIRQQIINLDNIQIKVLEIRVESNTERKLKNRIDVYIKTAMLNLLVLSELLSDAENCYNESDLDFLLEVTDEHIMEENKVND